MEPELPPDADESPTATPPPPAAPSFQILRSKHDRKLGGVAGGLAAATDLDPTLVRLAIVLGCLTGWGILAYLILWAVIPEEDPAKSRYLVPAPERTAKQIRVVLTAVGAIGVLHVMGTVLGIVSSALIGLGLFPARLFGIGRDSGFETGEGMLGLFLLVGGCLLLFRRHLPWLPSTDGGPGAGPSGGVAQSSPGTGMAPPGTGMALATMAPGSAGYGPPLPPTGTAGAGESGAGAFSARASAAARAARTNGPLLLVRAAGWLAGLWFLAAAVIGGVFWATGALTVHLPVLLVVTVLGALGFLGYTLLRSRRVAAVLGAVALLLVPTALALGVVRVDGQAGDRSVTPQVPSDLEREYRHAIGALRIDLSTLQLPAGRTPLDISMGAGQVEVTVPWDAEVEARASVDAGSFDLFGNRQTGLNLEGRSRSTGQPGAPVLVIDSEAGAGEIIVRRGSEPYTQRALQTGQPVPLSCYPSGKDPFGSGKGPFGAESNTMQCSAADGVTRIPAVACVVAGSGAALCRPVGEPEPAVAFADEPGTRRCQVPAGGGTSTCTAPVTGTPPPTSPTPPPIPSTPQPTTAPGEYRCTVPEGGGPMTCEPI